MTLSDREVVLDGSYGEGGGQILRTALSLAAIQGRPIAIENIRAGRPQPGLRPQHLAAVRAIAAICGAETSGDRVGSRRLSLRPGHPPRAGNYVFDVSELAGTGSAGAVSLVFQTILLPLALAEGDSTVVLRGGTHVPWSPSVHYLSEVYLPSVCRLGIGASLRLRRWGWYPRGGGEVVAHIRGGAVLRPHRWQTRGALLEVRILSATSNLPEHIRSRQAQQARRRLSEVKVPMRVELVDAPASSPGTCLFLAARFEESVAGFEALGRRGVPAERVADEAVDEFLAFLGRSGAVDPHLADQLILPLALSGGALTTTRVTRHLLTNIWIVERFLGARFELIGEEGAEGLVRCLS